MSYKVLLKLFSWTHLPTLGFDKEPDPTVAYFLLLWSLLEYVRYVQGTFIKELLILL